MSGSAESAAGVPRGSSFGGTRARLIPRPVARRCAQIGRSARVERFLSCENLFLQVRALFCVRKTYKLAIILGSGSAASGGAVNCCAYSDSLIMPMVITCLLPKVVNASVLVLMVGFSPSADYILTRLTTAHPAGRAHTYNK